MNKEWLETVRALAHKSMLGKLLAIAPPGGDESKSMRRRLDLLADFAQHVVEVADDEWSRSGADNRNVFTDGSHSEPPAPDRRTGPPDRRWTKNREMLRQAAGLRSLLVPARTMRRSTDKR